MRIISAKVLPLICLGGHGVKESVSATIVISGAIILFLCVGVFSQEAVPVQPSGDGRLEASLTQAGVRGKVFAVKVTLKNISNATIAPEIPFKDFYVTNVGNMTKYFPLKDSRGKFLAGPQDRDLRGGVFKSTIRPGDTRTIWVNFPVPPVTAKTVDLFVPGVLPFERIKISRGRG
jgi:hypothetical protein